MERENQNLFETVVLEFEFWEPCLGILYPAWSIWQTFLVNFCFLKRQTLSLGWAGSLCWRQRKGHWKLQESSPDFDWHWTLIDQMPPSINHVLTRLKQQNRNFCRISNDDNSLFFFLYIRTQQGRTNSPCMRVRHTHAKNMNTILSKHEYIVALTAQQVVVICTKGSYKDANL